jgi:hypothetical protein
MGILSHFEFHGFRTSIDLAARVAADPSFVALMRRMRHELGMSEAQASRIAENIMGRMLLRFGNHLVAHKGAIIDRVIALRTELDEAFHQVMEFNGGPATSASRSAANDRLRRIGALLEELDAKMVELGRPLHEIDPPSGAGDALAPLRALVTATTPTLARAGTVVRTVTHDVTASVSATGKRVSARILSGRYRFHQLADGSFIKYFADRSSAIFRVVGGRFHVELRNAAKQVIGHAVEFAVLHTPYGRRPYTTALMQANHGYQNSTMTRLFGTLGYDGNAVPTIWMRDSRHGSPHGMITAVQNAEKAVRNASGVTLEHIRDWTIADLRYSGMPDAHIVEYLRAIDDHFMRSVYPNIPVNQRKTLLGNWRPGAPL